MITEPCTPSGQLTVATTVVCSKPCLISTVSLSPAAAASTITVYDNATAGSGTVIIDLKAAANTASTSFVPGAPIYCANGCTAVVTGTSATGYVFFYREN